MPPDLNVAMLNGATIKHCMTRPSREKIFPVRLVVETQHVRIDQRATLSFFLLPHIQESAMFVSVSNCSASTKCMK